MAIQAQPSRIPEPFAGSGTKNTIPATNATPSASQAASWASGFPPECSQPISAGGCPVPRNDVNGALNQLSQDFAFRQDGGIWEWSALADYDAQRVVRGSDGILYWSVQPSGPGLASGAVDPTADDGTYWTSPSVKTVDAADSSSAAASTAWVNLWQQHLLLSDDLYVDSVNGDDNNDGLTASTAFKTVSKAINIINDPYSLTPVKITIHLADGVYTDILVGSPKTDIEYIGQSSNTVLSPSYVWSVDATNGTTVYISGTFTAKAGICAENNSFLRLQDGLAIYFKDINWATCIGTNNGGRITKPDGNNIAFNFSNITVSQGTVWCRNNSGIALGSGLETMSGAVTGRRYNIVTCSGVAGTGSTTFFPGTINGTTDSLSYYD